MTHIPIPPPSTLPLAADELPWRTAGLFSPHYLLHRLPSPESADWPDEAEADAVFEKTRTRFEERVLALKTASEEEVEGKWILPLLHDLGFGWNPRKAIPGIAARLLPDFLLYGSSALADAAFQSKQFYPSCLALLEAKRWGIDLSREGSKSKERSPQIQLRDYLGETPTITWGILTNGGRWRLTCKADRASSYFEFDLARVLAGAEAPETEASARAEFRLFYALFRRAAFERGPNGLCPLDGIREEAQQFKAEVERRLRVQVFDCVEILGHGFLENPANHLTPDDLPQIYQNCLILLYRILFVLNAEARALLPTHPRDTPSTKYYNSYGLEWVRRILAAPGGTQYDEDQTFALDARLRGLFTLINGKPGPPGKPDKNTELNVPRYNGGLFDPAGHPFLEAKHVADSFLANALRRLAYRLDDGEHIAFDYANLGERHLGSIYEGLLEHRLALSPDGALRLTNDKGERKTSGAYYTPEDWVAYIVSHTLQPLLAALPTTPLPDSFAEAVLRLNVCDPAMGSGHFLVEAVAYLAEAVAAHETTGPRPLLSAEGSAVLDEQGEPVCTEGAKLAYWKRRLVEACIYGVDLNPLAVELAKLSLWLETVDRVPLNFLDHHLRCGNSLLGTTLAALPSFPELKPSKKKKNTGQLSLGFSADLAEAVSRSIAEFAAIEGVSTDTHAAAKEKEKLWRNISETLMPRFRQAADLWLAPWFGADLGWLDFTSQFDAPDKTAALYAEYQSAVGPLRPFHWELEFPDIFLDADGRRRPDAGFDAVVGNPPWERMNLEENEFFSSRDPEIATASTGAKRKELIKQLEKEKPALWKKFVEARNRADNERAFCHKSNFFPLCGMGRTNLYAVFAEKALELINPTGRAGILVPSGIATDDTTKAFFQELISNRRLTELLDFENKNKIFEDVHAESKFSIVLMTGRNSPQQTIKCAFFLRDIQELNNEDQVFPLSPDDFMLFNPNTLTCPIFRRRRDAELTRKIYQNVPILLRESTWTGNHFSEVENPWAVSPKQGLFNMTSKSSLFKPASELEASGFWLGMGNIYTKGAEKYLPLYEGKMISQFDHRFANVIESEVQSKSAQASDTVEIVQKEDLDFSPMPRYWVPAGKVVPQITQTPKVIVEAYHSNSRKSAMDAVMYWVAGYWFNQGNTNLEKYGLDRVFPSYNFPLGWEDAFNSWIGSMACQEDEKKYPLTATDLETITQHADRNDVKGMIWALMLAHQPKWLLGFRDIANPNNNRTLISSIIPAVGVGNTLPLLMPLHQEQKRLVLLQANLSSFVLDYVVRQKVGNRHANFFVVEQLPVVPPERYGDDWHGVKLADFITARVLELCYTARDLQGFAADLGFTGPPFAWDDERRLHLKCQLDALYFHLYGLSAGEAGEILDTFPIVRRQDEAKYDGKFRTRALILGYYNAYAAGNMDAQVKG